MADPGWSVGPVLRVADVAVSVDYYCRRLGFACPDGSMIEGGHGEGPIYAVVRRSGIVVHLGLRRPDHELDPGTEPNALGVYFEVPDVDALHAELVERGAQVTRPPQDESYGMRDFAVVDLDGFNLAFGSPAGADHAERTS